MINEECVCADDQKDTCMCKESQAFGLSANNFVITLIMLYMYNRLMLIPGPEYCDACRNLRNETTLECIDECSNEFVIRDGYCLVINDECVCADDQKDTCMCKESQAFSLSANNLVITLIMLCIIDLC